MDGCAEIVGPALSEPIVHAGRGTLHEDAHSQTPTGKPAEHQTIPVPTEAGMSP